MHLPFLAKFSIKIASPFYLLQLHPIQILRLGDIEVALDTVAAGQGHGFDEVGGDELALCGGGGIEHLGPGQKLLVLFL